MTEVKSTAPLPPATTHASPPPAPSGCLGRFVFLIALLGAPALLGSQLWPAVRDNPGAAVTLLAGWWLLLGVSRFAGRVGGHLLDLWAPRVAALVNLVLLHRAVYRRGYVRRVVRDLRHVDLEGVPTHSQVTPLLEDVYVDVGVAPRPVHATLREPYLGATDLPGERRSLADLLESPEPVVLALIGGPGSGKTTLLRHTALDRCSRRRGLPVLLTVRDHADAILADPAITLSAVVASLHWVREHIPQPWFDRRLQRGRCLVLLDGLDEVAGEDDRRRIVDWVSAQITRYPRNDFVITSRPQGYESYPLRRATVLQVWRFSSEQVTRFVRGWYRAVERLSRDTDDPETRARARRGADDLLAQLHRQCALVDMAANPLLATMICHVHRYREALPGSRAELYGEMCEVLLYRRQDAKGVTDRAAALTGARRKLVLRALALHMMRARVSDLPTAELHRVVGAALARISQQVSAADFVAMAERSGLLVERESGVHAFAHMTFQEYLAAEEIRDKGPLDLLTGAVDDPWWRETTLLWSAGGDAGPVIEACLRSGGAPALALAFDCQDEAGEVAPVLRERLERLLTSPADPRLRRLIDQVMVTRALRRTVPLGERAELRAVPVTAGLYGRFARGVPRQGGVRGPEVADAGDDLPMSGLWDVDIDPFLAWIGEHAHGRPYRLPTRSELAATESRPIWCRDDDGRTPVTLTPAAPFEVQTATLRAKLAADARPVAAFGLVALGLDLDRDRCGTAAESVRAEARRVARALHLDQALARAHDRAFVLNRDRALDSDPDLSRAFALTRLLDLDPRLATLLSGPVDLPSDLRRWRLDALRPFGDLRTTAQHLLVLGCPLMSVHLLRTSASRGRRAHPPACPASIWAAEWAGREHAAVPPGRMRERAGVAARHVVSRRQRGNPLSTLAARVAEGVIELLDPLVARRVPATSEIATCLRFAAMTLVTTCREDRELRPAATAFLDVAYGVTALEERSTRSVTPDDLLLLVPG